MPPVPTGGPTPGNPLAAKECRPFRGRSRPASPPPARRRHAGRRGPHRVARAGRRAHPCPARRGRPIDLMARGGADASRSSARRRPGVAAGTGGNSVATIARAYQPGTVRKNLPTTRWPNWSRHSAGSRTKSPPARIALLVQTCDATAGLVGNAVLRAATNCLVAGTGLGACVRLVAGAVDADGLVGNARSGLATNCLVDGVVAGAGLGACGAAGTVGADGLVGDAGLGVVTNCLVDGVVAGAGLGACGRWGQSVRTAWLGMLRWEEATNRPMTSGRRVPAA